MVQVGRGNPAAALPLLHEVLSRARALEHPRREARARLELGRAYRAAGRLAPAAEHLEEGLAVAREWDQRPLALDMLAELAEVREGLGDPRRALAASRAHLALRDSIFSQSAAQSVAAMEARTDAESRLRENQRLREEQRVREAVIQRQRANGDLRAALSEVQTLKGLIPICAHCKKIRDDEGFWKSVESYISDRSEAQFSHSICAECGPDAYGADWEEAPSDPDSPSIAGADPSRLYAATDDA